MSNRDFSCLIRAQSDISTSFRKVFSIRRIGISKALKASAISAHTENVNALSRQVGNELILFIKATRLVSLLAIEDPVTRLTVGRTPWKIGRRHAQS
jgi:hypothetical protein